MVMYNIRVLYILGVFLLIIVILAVQRNLSWGGVTVYNPRDVYADSSLQDLMGLAPLNGTKQPNSLDIPNHEPTKTIITTITKHSTASPQTNQSLPGAKKPASGRPVRPNVFEGYVLPDGLRLAGRQHLGKDFRIDEKLDETQAEKIFMEFLHNDHVECTQRRRHGNQADGGWDMCISGPFLPKIGAPCLVYSFGINFDWTFDDSVSEEYGCEVRSFDPSMNKAEHQHSQRVWFYPWGLGAANRQAAKGGWQLKSLGSILSQLSDDNSIIDYLKIDIEGAEWDCLETMFTENVLPRVKQLGFEIHTQELGGHRQPSSTAQYIRYIRILSTLETLGFRKWYTHLNEWGLFQSTRTQRFISCCYEMVYVNLNFINPDYLADGLPPLNLTIASRPTPEKPKLAQNTSKTGVNLLPKQRSVYPEFQQLSRRGTVELTYEHSIKMAERIFYNLLGDKSIMCPQSMLIGTDKKTGWKICTQKPYALPSKCDIFSFGVFNDTSFAVNIAKKTKCKLHAFNPRLEGNTTGVVKYNELALGSNKTTNSKGQKMDTFYNILLEKGYLETTIHVAKIELVTNDDWSALNTILLDGTIARLQQLVLLLCIEEDQLNTGEINVSQLVFYWKILRLLESKGFGLWNSSPADTQSFVSKWTNLQRPTCTKLSFINVHLLV